MFPDTTFTALECAQEEYEDVGDQMLWRTLHVYV